MRHLEYYRGILFLTTNRVKAFDDAILSRIHVALHYQELTKAARIQIWTAFLKKIGTDFQDFGPEQMESLGEHAINGRQIKNVVRTAHSIAMIRHEKLGMARIEETLATMLEFTAQFPTS